MTDAALDAMSIPDAVRILGQVAAEQGSDLWTAREKARVALVERIAPEHTERLYQKAKAIIDAPVRIKGLAPCGFCKEIGKPEYEDRQNRDGWWSGKVTCGNCFQSINSPITKSRGKASQSACWSWNIVQIYTLAATEFYGKGYAKTDVS